jgi:hypothetical protein
MILTYYSGAAVSKAEKSSEAALEAEETAELEAGEAEDDVAEEDTAKDDAAAK